MPGYFAHIYRIPGKSTEHQSLGKHPGILGWLEQLSAFHDTRAPLNRLLDCLIEQLEDRERTFGFAHE